MPRPTSLPTPLLPRPLLAALLGLGGILSASSLAAERPSEGSVPPGVSAAQERAARASLERARLEQGLIRAERTALMWEHLERRVPSRGRARTRIEVMESSMKIKSIRPLAFVVLATAGASASADRSR